MGYRPLWSRDKFAVRPLRLGGKATARIAASRGHGGRPPRPTAEKDTAVDKDGGALHPSPSPSPSPSSTGPSMLDIESCHSLVLSFACVCPTDLRNVGMTCKSLLGAALEAQESIIPDGAVDFGTRMVLDRAGKDGVGMERRGGEGGGCRRLSIGLDGEFYDPEEEEEEDESDDEDDDEWDRKHPYEAGQRKFNKYLKSLERECLEQLDRVWERPRQKLMLEQARKAEARGVARAEEKSNEKKKKPRLFSSSRPMEERLTKPYPLPIPPDGTRWSLDGKLLGIGRIDWKDMAFMSSMYYPPDWDEGHLPKKYYPVEISFSVLQDSDLSLPNWLVYLANRILLPRGYVIDGECCLVEDYGSYGVVRMTESKLRLFFNHESGSCCGVFTHAGYLEYLSHQHLVPLYYVREPDTQRTASEQFEMLCVVPHSTYHYIYDQWDEKQELYCEQLKQLMCTKYAGFVERNPHLGLTDDLERIRNENADQQAGQADA